MKKIFFGISMMLLSAMSFTAAAQSQEAKACAKENSKQEQCDKQKKCDKKECKGEIKCDKAAKQCDKAAQKCDKAGKQCDKATKKCCKDSAGVAGRRFDRNARPVGMKGPKGHHGERPQGRMVSGQRDGSNRDLFKGIELNAEQKEKISALEKKMVEERQAAKAEAKDKKSEAKADMRKAREEGRKAYDAAVKEILTKDQYAQFEINRKEAQVRMEGRKDMDRMKRDVRKAETTVEKKVEK